MNAAEPILAYLQGQMPTYPFDPRLDAEFVDELLADFRDLDILEETKTFRWYYHNRPGDRFKNVRVGLRRWIATAKVRKKTE
jgi:hypothetical protein